jgi:large subunit ribosomal protein L4
MKINVVTLENKAAGELELSDAVFGLTPRGDILQRVVEWQRAKARAGTHKTKTRAEVSGTGKKPFKQKGTGGARQGTTRGPHQEGGGRAHGPVVRSHEYSLTKKVRALGLKHALSSKAKEGKLIIVDAIALKEVKTKAVSASGMACPCRVLAAGCSHPPLPSVPKSLLHQSHPLCLQAPRAPNHE